jgi:uncharacterized membrane protein
MMAFFTPFLAALVAMLAIDGVWLATMSQRFYKANIGHLMAASPNLPAAGVFYLIYISALVVLVVQPALKGGFSFGQIFIMGAMLGLGAYATYDLTNQATLKDWPVILTVVDLAWGTVLTGVVGCVSVAVTRWLA